MAYFLGLALLVCSLAVGCSSDSHSHPKDAVGSQIIGGSSVSRSKAVSTKRVNCELGSVLRAAPLRDVAGYPWYLYLDELTAEQQVENLSRIKSQAPGWNVEISDRLFPVVFTQTMSERAWVRWNKKGDAAPVVNAARALVNPPAYTLAAHKTTGWRTHYDRNALGLALPTREDGRGKAASVPEQWIARLQSEISTASGKSGRVEVSLVAVGGIQALPDGVKILEDDELTALWQRVPVPKIYARAQVRQMQCDPVVLGDCQNESGGRLNGCFVPGQPVWKRYVAQRGNVLRMAALATEIIPPMNDVEAVTVKGRVPVCIDVVTAQTLDTEWCSSNLFELLGDERLGEWSDEGVLQYVPNND